MIKTHKNFPCYKVYSDGRIWSDKYNRFLRLSKDKDGYLELKTSSDRIKAHRLVAELFIPNPLNLPMVNHKDGVKNNNDINNLEWVDNSLNMCHAYSTGLMPIGENNVHSILTEKEVLTIKSTYVYRHNKFGCSGLAIQYNVAEQTIRDIIKNRTWKHLVDSIPSTFPVYHNYIICQ